MNAFFIIVCVWQSLVGVWLFLYGKDSQNPFLRYMGVTLLPIAYLVFYVIEKLTLKDKR